jgi:hypothetical protein
MRRISARVQVDGAGVPVKVTLSMQGSKSDRERDEQRRGCSDL